MNHLVNIDRLSVVARIEPRMWHVYHVARALLQHPLRVIPCLTDHVNMVTLRYFGRVVSRLPKFLLVETAVGFDARLYEANLDGLAGKAEGRDHASKDMVVNVDVLEVGEQVL